MQLIGKGTFTQVYREGNSQVVYLKSDDKVKECMAFFPFTGRCFPTVKLSDKEGYDYLMKYYPKHRSLKSALKPKEWEKYKDLRHIFNRYSNVGYFTLRDSFKNIQNRTLKSNMLDALDNLANYGEDICFEIQPRNVAVSPTGNLVLLDVFFIQEQLIKKTSYYFKNNIKLKQQYLNRVCLKSLEAKEYRYIMANNTMKLKHAKFEITTLTGKNIVSGLVSPNFGIHRENNCYKVTHLKSGCYMCYGVGLQKIARAFVKGLENMEDVDWSWITPENIDYHKEAIMNLFFDVCNKKGSY